MGIEYGTVINKTDPAVVKKSGPVKAATKLTVGLVYYTTNGWDKAPIDGSIHARNLYWNPIELDNTNGVKGDLSGTFYGLNARVVGKAEGAIVKGKDVMASETTAQSFAELAEPSDAASGSAAEINAVRDYAVKLLGGYLGHTDEILSKDSEPTDAADAETNCVFVIKGGFA